MKCIYSIVNLKNGKSYIGSTSNFARRKKDHIYKLKNNKHANKILQNSWNKNGEAYFIFNIIEKLEDTTSLIEREQFYIDYYKSHYSLLGYNIAKFAEAPHGTNNIKKVYQYSLNGILLNVYKNCVEAATSLNLDCSGLSKCARNKYRFYGGFIWIYEGDNTEENIKNRVSLATRPLKRTDASKEKMRQSAKKRTDNLKPILQFSLDEQFIKEWKSTADMVKELGFSNGHISDCLHGKHKTARGFIWKFKN